MERDVDQQDWFGPLSMGPQPSQAAPLLTVTSQESCEASQGFPQGRPRGI